MPSLKNTTLTSIHKNHAINIKITTSANNNTISNFKIQENSFYTANVYLSLFEGSWANLNFDKLIIMAYVKVTSLSLFLELWAYFKSSTLAAYYDKINLYKLIRLKRSFWNIHWNHISSNLTPKLKQRPP